MKKIYIVTGANGFLGNNIVRELLKDKSNEVRALILPNDKINSLKDLDCAIYYGDVTDKNSLSSIFKVNSNDEVYVIHCAAIVYIKSKYNENVIKVNYYGTKNIVDKVLEIKAKLIYINSVHAIPEKKNNQIMKEIKTFDPNRVKGIYAKSKAMTAKYVLDMVKEKDLNACILHPSGIIGPFDYGHSHLTQLIIDFYNGSLKACVNGGYDFVDVRDVVNAVKNSCELKNQGECYIISNKYYTIKELLDVVSDVTGIKKIKTVLPMWFAKITAPLSEFYYHLKKQPPLYTSYSLYTLTSNSNFSHEKADKELNYQPRDMKETIKDTVSWLNRNL